MGPQGKRILILLVVAAAALALCLGVLGVTVVREARGRGADDARSDEFYAGGWMHFDGKYPVAFLRFGTNGRWTLWTAVPTSESDFERAAWGTYSTTGHTITFESDTRCRERGTYTWAQAENVPSHFGYVTFFLVDDKCTERRAMLKDVTYEPW